MKSIVSYLKTYGDKKLYIKLFLSGIITSLLLIFLPLIQKRIIDYIMAGDLSTSDLSMFLILSIMMILITFVESYLLISFQLNIQKKFSIKLLNSVSRTESFVIKTRGSGAFLNSVFGDAEQISMMLASSNYFIGLFNLVTMLVILVITSKWMIYFPIIILISYILCILLIQIIDKKQREYFNQGREEIFKLNPKTLEFIENRRSIMSFASFNAYLNDLDESIDQRDISFRKSMAASNVSKSLIDSMKSLTMVLIFIISMLMILAGKLNISNFITMVAYLPICFLPLYSYKDIKDNAGKIEMLHSRNEDSLNAKASFILPNSTDIAIENLSLDYDDKNIISNLSLDIDKMYGIIGVSGEGKSTILKLLLGDINPDKGSVKYGGVDISKINLSLRYSLYKMYFQDNEIFDASLRANIALSKEGISKDRFVKEKASLVSKYKQIRKDVSDSIFDINNIDPDLFVDILDIADLSDNDKNQIIKSTFENMTDEKINLISDIKVNKNYYIDEKYNKLVSELDIGYLEGRDFGQRGSNISGGEKNKISLARLLLVETDLPYLIDEPFTSIDLLSEKVNLNIFKKYISGKRGIIISHKIDVINELADEIIVISGSREEARGDHKYLLENSKLYKDLYAEHIYKKKNLE